MKNRTAPSEVLFLRNDQPTPLGHLSLAGTLTKRDRSDFKSMRVLGSYAIVYLLEGSGHYRDANGISQRLRAGDLILIFPEIAHRYGPQRGDAWHEIYVVFDGPAFDLWRGKGVLRAAQPVLHLAPTAHWLQRIKSTLQPASSTEPGHEMQNALQNVAAFLNLLTEILAPQQVSEGTHEEKWLCMARRRLDADLSVALDMREVARESGVSYESFRKRFAAQVGVAPARYRTERRIAAAQALLAQSNLTLRAVANNLGFSDEFHFSRRFKEVTGQTPREFRLNSHND
jgi:AraC-like DNA-binding protein